MTQPLYKLPLYSEGASDSRDARARLVPITKAGVEQIENVCRGDKITSAAIGDHAHDASDITTGVVDPARLGSGTPTSTTVLLGNMTWGSGLPAVDHASDHEAGGGDALDLGSIAGTITSTQHGTISTGDPHAQYALDADLAAHLADADPHPTLQRESEKGVANGYAGLGADGKVPSAQLPASGAADWDSITNKPATFAPTIGATAVTAVAGNDARLSDARTPTAHTHDDRYYTESEVDTALGTKQASNANLTTIAGLTPTTDNFIVAAASAWASRTPAQAKTSLGLVKADVGLGNVDNTSDAAKPVSTATQAALDGKAATTHNHDATYAALSHTHNASAIDAGTLDIARLPTVTVAKGGTGLTAVGTALHGLRVNAAGNALEYAAITASVAAPFTGNQATGDFTIADGQFGIHGKRLTLTSTQRATLQGSARLILCG